MKALFSCPALALSVAIAAPGLAGTVTIGNSTARDCWEAAEARDFDRNAFSHCDLALRQESLTRADRAATLNNRGVLYLRARDFRSAGRDFDAAVATYDGNAEAWLNKAISALRRGGGMETLPMIEKSLELGTERQALAYYSRSIAYERGGKLRAAYRDLVKASELAPGWNAPAEDLKHYVVKR
jgi:tetratricopeptide (TPR) repeat protein